MKKTISLNENELISLIKKIVSEQTNVLPYNSKFFKNNNNLNNDYLNYYKKNMPNGVYTDFDKSYDYKLSNGVWYTKPKNSSSNWIDLTGNSKALSILSDKLEQEFNKSKDVVKKDVVKKDVVKKDVVKKDVVKKDVVKKDVIPVVKSDTLISKSTNPIFVKKIKDKNNFIRTNNSTAIFDAGQGQCAQFVREFLNLPSSPGDAWVAHDNSRLGNLVFSSFHGLNPEEIKKSILLWKTLNKKGGGVENGDLNSTISSFVNSLTPSTPPVDLKLGDIVGIYNPKSPHNEEAFYQAGKIFFTKDSKGKPIAGNTIKSGDAWGMNTHLGVVGAIKNGTPIIFHNIKGQVWADPTNQIHGGGRIAWVRRHGGQPVALNTSTSNLSRGISEENLINRLKKKALTEQKPDNLMPGQTDNPQNTNKVDYNKFDKYSCIIELGFRPVVDKLISQGYDKTFLKAALGVIGRESSFASGLRYNITSPLKIAASFFGSDTSIGPAQMKKSTSDDLKLKESITTLRGSLIAVYKYLLRSYEIAKNMGYQTNSPSSNFTKGTGNAALDITIASYNIGVGRIKKYCSTDDPSIKRSCSDAGKIVEQSVIGAPNMGVTTQKSTPKVKKTKYKVSNKVALNYLPNFKTKRWDGVNISTHGYVEEVSKNIKSFNCF